MIYRRPTPDQPLAQACDLAQTKSTRVLVAMVHEAQYLVIRGVLKGTLIRDQIRNHRVYGWYFLPASENLAQHFATTHARVGLPLPYETQADT